MSGLSRCSRIWYGMALIMPKEGDILTVNGDIITIGGQIIFEKGQKVAVKSIAN